MGDAGCIEDVQPREKKINIFIWKLGMGLVKGNSSIEFIHNSRRGWTAVPKTTHQGAPTCVRNARDASLAVKGVALFNLCPQGLWDMASDHQERFKQNLVAF